MKKVIAVTLVSCLALSACSQPKVINGKEYQPYGIATLDRADPKIQYEASITDAVVGILLFETVVAPVLIVGWDIMEPVGPKKSAP